MKMEPDAEPWVKTVKEEYVEADKEIKIESGVIIKKEAINPSKSDLNSSLTLIEN